MTRLLFALTLLIPEFVYAQVTVVGGVGWFDADPGVMVSAGAELPLSGTVSAGLTGLGWRRDTKRYYAVMPTVSWRATSAQIITFQGGVGIGARRYFSLCPVEPEVDPSGSVQCGGARYQKSWIMTLAGTVVPQVDWPIQPLIEVRYTTTLGALGEQPPGMQDVSLISLGIGFSTGR